MKRDQTRFVRIVSYLRWAIPVVIAIIGAGYILFEMVLLQGHILSEGYIIRMILVIGLVGPALAWVILTWTLRATRAEAKTQIENARLYEEVRRHAAFLETASLIGQRMTAVLDLNSLLREVVRLIRQKFGYYHVHILLVDEQARDVVLKEASGPSSELIKARGLRLKIGKEGITGWVAHTGQTLVCNDVSREPRFYAAELVPETKAELAVPLRVGNRVIGVLDVQSDRRDAFDKEDATVLQVLGNQIGIAIENARLFQETQWRYDAMVALHETSLDIISQVNTTELLESLLRRGALLVNAETSSLSIYDATQELIRNVANYNTERDWSGITFRPGEGLIGQIILKGKPLIVNDYQTWPNRIEIFKDVPQTRGMGAPLKWQNHIIGGVTVSSRPEALPFEDKDLWLLTQFADLATIAIKRAELHTQVKEFSHELEKKVEERTRELSKANEEIAVKAGQLRSLWTKTIHIQEEERARIARDMHDGVIQMISAARYELQAANVGADSKHSSPKEKKLAAAYQVLEEMEREIRRVIYHLHPPILDALGLGPALQKYAQRFQNLSGIPCHTDIQGSPYRLPATTEVAVFRLVGEALQNVAAHSGAQAASVFVDYDCSALRVTVEDNGQGFDFERWKESRNGTHLGLLGMQERVEGLGGKMVVWSEVGQGSRVMFELPVIQGED